jgi:hypothetical protein
MMMTKKESLFERIGMDFGEKWIPIALFLVSSVLNANTILQPRNLFKHAL